MSTIQYLSFTEQNRFVFRQGNKHVYHQNCHSSVTRTIIPQVLGFAAFFALVLKKVDQEEFGEPQIDESLRCAGTLISSFLISSKSLAQYTETNKKISFSLSDPDMLCAVRRDSTCSFYQPPPPTDVERMRNNMIKEQKVFALIREILGRGNHFGV